MVHYFVVHGWQSKMVDFPWQHWVVSSQGSNYDGTLFWGPWVTNQDGKHPMATLSGIKSGLQYMMVHYLVIHRWQTKMVDFPWQHWVVSNQGCNKRKVVIGDFLFAINSLANESFSEQIALWVLELGIWGILMPGYLDLFSGGTRNTFCIQAVISFAVLNWCCVGAPSTVEGATFAKLELS